MSELGNPDLIDVLSNPGLYGFKSPVRGNHSLRFAQVVDINDEQKRGRVCVRVIGMQAVTNPDGGAVGKDQLHWANSVFATAGNGYGDFHLPKVGDIGFVLFAHGDFRQPVWLGCLFSSPGGQPNLPLEFQEQYDDEETAPQVRGTKTEAGHKFILRDRAADREMVIETAAGRRVVIRDTAQGSGSGAKQGVEVKAGAYHIKLNEEDGELDIAVPGECKINVSGNAVLTVGGNIKLGNDALVGGGAGGDGVVTGKCICAFTGAPHPDASLSVSAKKT